MLEEVSGADMVGWRYAGPFDDLPAVRTAFAAGTRDDPDHPYQHVVVPWSEVGEDEGTGIVHIAPGCGTEDFQLGKELGLPVVAPIDEAGIFLDGFGNLTGHATSATRPTRSSSTSSARAASTGSRPSPTATRIAGGAGRRSSSASSTSGSSAWARSTTSRARR